MHQGSMWQICPRSKSKKKNSIGKYKGAKNVTFKAKGKVTFDMDNIAGITMLPHIIRILIFQE